MSATCVELLMKTSNKTKLIKQVKVAFCPFVQLIEKQSELFGSMICAVQIRIEIEEVLHAVAMAAFYVQRSNFLLTVGYSTAARQRSSTVHCTVNFSAVVEAAVLSPEVHVV